jgi:hypothetical protein
VPNQLQKPRRALGITNGVHGDGQTQRLRWERPGLVMVLLSLVLLVGVISGCGTTGQRTVSANASTTVSTTVFTPEATSGVYAITGRATSPDDSPVGTIALGFKLTTSPAGCATCGFHPAVTGDDGNYSIGLPSGSYLVECDAGAAYACQIATSPPQVVAKVNVDGPGVLNLLVSAKTEPNTTTSPVSPATVPPTPTTAASDPGDVISGHVYDESGQPVAGATVEFKSGCGYCDSQPWTKTDSSGGYSMTLSPGIYNALCVTPYNCGPKGGNGGPFPVKVPPGGSLDFIVCSGSSDYPQCLTR